jgi:hypothetical protein
MTKVRSGTERMGGADLEDVEWELLCSAREATVGFAPATAEQRWAKLRAAGTSRPWDSGYGPAGATAQSARARRL